MRVAAPFTLILRQLQLSERQDQGSQSAVRDRRGGCNNPFLTDSLLLGEGGERPSARSARLRDQLGRQPDLSDDRSPLFAEFQSGGAGRQQQLLPDEGRRGLVPEKNNRTSIGLRARSNTFPLTAAPRSCRSSRSSCLVANTASGASTFAASAHRHDAQAGDRGQQEPVLQRRVFDLTLRGRYVSFSSMMPVRCGIVGESFGWREPITKDEAPSAG